MNLMYSYASTIVTRVNFHHYTDFEKALVSIIDTFSNLNGYNLDAILYMDQRATLNFV